MTGLNTESNLDTPKKGAPPSKRCEKCGYRVRSKGHDNGPHHSRGQIGKEGERIIMSQGRKSKHTLREVAE